MLLSLGHANTQIQIHKYRNTVWVKFEDRPNMRYIFLKVQGPQKQCFRLSDVQLHKYTNKVWVEGDAPKVIKKYHIKGKAHKFQYGKCRIRPVFSV